MELWVRSQTKEILKKTNNIELEYLDFKKYSYAKDIQSKGEWAIRGNGETIGQYKSKQRALEILDEIQNILKPVIITTGYECDIKDNPIDKTCFNLEMIPNKTEIQQITSYVYEMPEE